MEFTTCCNGIKVLDTTSGNFVYRCRICGKEVGKMTSTTVMKTFNESSKYVSINATEKKRYEKLATRYATDPTVGYSNLKCKKCDCYLKFLNPNEKMKIFICPNYQKCKTMISK